MVIVRCYEFHCPSFFTKSLSYPNVLYIGLQQCYIVKRKKNDYVIKNNSKKQDIIPSNLSVSDCQFFVDE